MDRFSTSPLANSASFETCQKVGLAAYASDTPAQTAASASATREILVVIRVGLRSSVSGLQKTPETEDRRLETSVIVERERQRPGAAHGMVGGDLPLAQQGGAQRLEAAAVAIRFHHRQHRRRQ